MVEELLQFGDVTVDLRRVSVKRAGRPVPLEPKTFDVLRYLLEHRDRLVTKEELLDVVWANTFVTPNVLTRAVAQLRKALGDDAFEARYIETAARRGYRFIAAVEAGTVRAAAPASLEGARPSAPVVPTLPARRRVPLAAVLGVVGVTVVTIGLLYLAVNRSSPAQPGAAMAPRRLTVGAASYSFPAISPDGRTVAYTSDRTGSMELYTVGLASGSKELPITADGGQNTHAEWSPDGQWLAYHSRKNGGIWIVPSGGGVARRVVDFGSRPAWSSGGERLVFTSDAGGMAAQSILWSVHREGSGLRPLTTLGSPRGGHSQPTVSPDGRLVVFTVSLGNSGLEVWTVPMAGGTGLKLGTGTLFASPHFSADSRAVYWVDRTPEGNDALMRVAIDERGAAVGAPDAVFPFTGSFVGGLSISRNGMAVLSLFQATANLWAVGVPGDGPPAPPVQLTFDDARDTLPRYSPGGRVAFHQQAMGRMNTAWLLDGDGKGPQPLTTGMPVSVWGPQWAPDDRRLFVMVTTEKRELSYAWLDTATRQLIPILVPAAGAFNPSLSPDGREIAFHVIDEAGVLNVWTRPLDGGPRKQVTFDREAMSYPQWSPDGQWLVLEIKRGDQTRIGVVSRAGGAVEEIVSERGQNWPSSWASDNDRVAFAGERAGVWNIYAVSRETKAIQQLTSFTSVNGYVRYPTWSPQGDRVVFERAEHKGSLWTVRLP